MLELDALWHFDLSSLLLFCVFYILVIELHAFFMSDTVDDDLCIEYRYRLVIKDGLDFMNI